MASYTICNVTVRLTPPLSIVLRNLCALPKYCKMAVNCWNLRRIPGEISSVTARWPEYLGWETGSTGAKQGRWGGMRVDIFDANLAFTWNTTAWLQILLNALFEVYHLYVFFLRTRPKLFTNISNDGELHDDVRDRSSSLTWSRWHSSAVVFISSQRLLFKTR